LIEPKAGSKLEGPKNFPAALFLNTFLQMAIEKKYSKNGAAGNFFGPSYFVTALDNICKFQF
jgi:hypothetical protein